MANKRNKTLMKRRDKQYKEAVKRKGSQRKIKEYQTYKKYRSKIVNL